MCQLIVSTFPIHPTTEKYESIVKIGQVNLDRDVMDPGRDAVQEPGNQVCQWLCGVMWR